MNNTIRALKKQISEFREEIYKIRQNSVSSEIYINLYNENEQLLKEVKKYKELAQKNYDECVKLSFQLKKYTEEK